MSLRKMPGWSNIEKVQAGKDRFQEVISELQANKFNNEDFKSKLVVDNQYWFTSNIKEVFTPTTLKR